MKFGQPPSLFILHILFKDKDRYIWQGVQKVKMVNNFDFIF